MKVIKKKENNKAIISIAGEIDSMNADEFEKRIFEETEGESEVVLDLRGLEYVSSAGLVVFLLLQRKYGSDGSLVLINANEDVMDIFTVSGFSRLLRFE